MEACNSNRHLGDPYEEPHSPHAKVTVTNVSQQQQERLDKARLKTSEQKINRDEDPCSTPKKQPAKKILFKVKETKPTTESDGTSTCDVSFNEFLARVKLAQQDTRRHALFGEKPQENHVKKKINITKDGVDGIRSPDDINVPMVAMLPEYARYHRAINCGNSSNLPPTSPGVEWVAERPSPRDVDRSWDEDTLVAQHAFPTSIFCAARGAEGDVQPPSAASLREFSRMISYDMSDVSFHELARRQSFQDSSSSTSIPSAAALSGGSISSWSEEEQMGVRRFLDLIERNSSFPDHCHQYQQLNHQQHQSRRNSATPQNNEVTMVEISPGVSEPLRKADETMRAVRNDFYVPVSCFGCSEDIFCIADAKYVICPTCRVVSPIEGVLEGQVLEQRGLGLGFTCESLFQIQSEILSER